MATVKNSTKKHKNPETCLIKVKYEALVHLKHPVSGIAEDSLLKNVADILYAGIHALRLRDGAPAIDGVSDGSYTLGVFFPKKTTKTTKTKGARKTRED